MTPHLDAPAQASDSSPCSLAPDMLSFSETNPSHPSLPAACSCPAPSCWPCLQERTRVWWGQRQRSDLALGKMCWFFFFLLPCVIFQLDQFPWLAQGGTGGHVAGGYVAGGFPLRWRGMKHGEMQGRQEPARLLNETIHPHLSAQVAGEASGETEPNCLQQALD